MYFVYLLRCSDGTLYTGCTNNLDRRLAAHNAGKGNQIHPQPKPGRPGLLGQAADRSAALRRAPSSGSPGGRSWS